jgi:hypothetical protein
MTVIVNRNLKNKRVVVCDNPFKSENYTNAYALAFTVFQISVYLSSSSSEVK